MNTTAGGGRESVGPCTKRRVDCLTFGTPGMVCLLHNLHQIWPPTPELAIPQEETLWAYVLVDETGDRWTKRLLLIRA